MRNSFIIAFSMYSKIPMPNCEWNEKNQRYSMIFFPWVGALIGALTLGAHEGFAYLQKQGIAFSSSFVSIVLLLLPVFLTGGIHLDGLLDTADAMNSWGDQKKRLEILSDSHVGAFAVLVAIVYFLLDYGIYTMLNDKSIKLLSLSFVLSRSFSALSVVSFPKAKETGLARLFADAADQRIVSRTLGLYLLALAGLMIWIGQLTGLFTFLAALLFYGYYYVMSKRYFGGMTGDLAGFFLQGCELLMAAVCVLTSLFLR